MDVGERRRLLDGLDPRQRVEVEVYVGETAAVLPIEDVLEAAVTADGWPLVLILAGD